jgi:hypothetical protein
MRARSYVVMVAMVGACARHGESPTAPDDWVTTFDQPSRRVAVVPTSLPTPQPTPRETCTLMQKLAMRLSGMSEDRIRKACE